MLPISLIQNEQGQKMCKLRKKPSSLHRKGKFQPVEEKRPHPPLTRAPAAGCDSKRKGMPILFLEHTAIVLTLRRFAAKNLSARHSTQRSFPVPHSHPAASLRPKKVIAGRPDDTYPLVCAKPVPSVDDRDSALYWRAFGICNDKKRGGEPPPQYSSKKKKAGVVRDTTC
ncbi:hypothetical protein, unlikely [Trypanosoma brucei brucei TREU927]|uniref:Uncharacterized protein n=1 Tax=Trypanosoma brucei brucei (strain 927/4 GUTat10.1) TaxID=185431 RepID=Q38FK5_TRYB2|nr:hypothetical protein, unlikely [Trypanosoma brucei brucei TREU927]EAN76415.1 hypothetical protein, unlikely [Trypanosoma brucei brucei TREU927]